VRAAGRRACVVEADLVDRWQTERMVASTVADLGPIDLLILNASGGLEKGKDAGYALKLNLDAQVGLVDAALPYMRRGGRIVFVTSHPAHFYGQKPVMPAYEVVAASKHAGESALRTRVPEFAALGISLVVVSGDMIEGTITPRLLERTERGSLEARRAQVGSLPTVDEFAAAIVGAALDPTLESGATIFVGSVD
jgi:NAD(P)-dependent dehydrogenase (short-subunit alcohol dehydrogenase family)